VTLDNIDATDIRDYWNEHIHDLEIATAPLGSPQFFAQLTDYRFDKLHYLPQLVDFNGYAGQDLLEVGCGVGIDLARFAQGGAHVTGIDLSDIAIKLARTYFDQRGFSAELDVMNGEAMAFPDNQFDVVYAHGVLQYTVDSARMAAEIHRVLKPGGLAIVMVYNTWSWLNALAKLLPAELEHTDAPGFRTFSQHELRELLKPFHNLVVIPERFPVKTRLHSGLKAKLYNNLFVGTFNTLPRKLTRPTGWHLMAFASK
jgi:SAM-dependent methyltransferase